MALRAQTVRRLLVFLLVVCWEVLPRIGLVPPLFLPPLSLTLQALGGNAQEYAEHLSVTLQEIGISIVIACGGGIAAGLFVGSVIPVRRLMLPVISGFYAVPLIVLYPLFTAWLGIGSGSKIAFASIYGFLPTLLGTAAGVQTIDRQLITVARSMGANAGQRVVRVLVPAAIPTVLSSFRVGGALVIVGVVVAEMLTSAAGIGFLITRYRTMLDSAHVFAAILLVLFLAIAFDRVVQFIESRTAGWRKALRSDEVPAMTPAT
jgi:NitT/TauT family transport system permease protein